MPSKPKTTKDEAVGADPAPEAPEPGTTRTGVDILPADRAVLDKDIDTRMKALLKDHQAMGARPK
jgi:hypothetical protein